MSRRRARIAPIVAVGWLAGWLAGCGIQPDASPQDAPGEIQNQVTTSEEIAEGTDLVYLVAPGEDQLLRSRRRDSISGENLIDILFNGPNQSELDLQYQSSIPAGTEVLSTRPLATTMNIDVSAELGELTGEPLVRALAQIVWTTNELPNVDSVVLTIEGETRSWPTGNGELKTGQLTIYDYPTAVQTAQPPYPALADSA